MNPKTFLKVVVYVPSDYVYLIREILSDIGAGETNHYEFYTFSVKGVRRSRSLAGPRALLGQTDEIELKEEERIESFIPAERKEALLNEIRNVHPYIHPIVDFYRVEDSTCFSHFEEE
jgi:hypothetical protein